ncbi:MAG: hypothetical protein JWP01_1929 [Myxococcales bacterium]|nr:hypothetical protein [Myxococcales bacterium]
MPRAQLEITAPIKRDELLRLLKAMTPLSVRARARFPRATRPSPMARATTPIRSLAIAEHKAPRTVAELRARLDRGESAALWAASCELSPRVVAHLRAEASAMVSAEVEPSLPEANPAPRIGVTPVPGTDVAAIPAARRAGRVPAAGSQRFATIIASLAVLFLVGLVAVLCLV